MTPGTIAAAAAALRAGTVSSAALVEASLAAIDRHQAATNAFITVDPQGARAAAAAVDAERARGVDRGPLHGIPISLKDLIDQQGLVTSAASRVLATNVADADAPLVTRLKDAGAIIFGRTNLHEFALGTTSEDSAFGSVHHPKEPHRSAGGSSGGSAAAVASGMGLASIGTDTGGSVRIPAACCGLVGLKPCAGEISTEGVVPLSTTLDHVGPLARSVQDAAWLYAVMAGRSVWTVQPASTGALRMRLLTGHFEEPLQLEVATAFAGAIAALGSAGVTIERGAIASAARIPEIYVNIVLAEAAAWHARYLDTRGEAYTPLVRARLESGRTISAVTYLHARDAQRALAREVDAALEDVDALVLPTLPVVAPPLGATDITLDPATGATLPIRAAMLKHTQLFNLSGHPAVTLPLAGPGWPVGLQLVGRSDGTDRLLAIAAACEKIVS